jgi:hypothetical protein
MEWAALITWVATAGGGFFMLGLWLKHGGMQQSDQRGARIRSARILSHFALAAVGLVIWIIYVASDSDALAWVAFGLLLVVALLGFSMLAIWFGQRRRPTATAGPSADTDAAAEQHFPVVVVALHGVLAAATLVLVLLTAAGVGGS